MKGEFVFAGDPCQSGSNTYCHSERAEALSQRGRGSGESDGTVALGDDRVLRKIVILSEAKNLMVQQRFFTAFSSLEGHYAKFSEVL